VEAASIAWRPLGRLLVEKGLLSDEELELALAKQQLTGKRLGETIVECGFVSRPELSDALAAQYGIELKTETGFGTGLRAQIQQRHESDRGRVVQIGIAEAFDEPELPEDAGPQLELVHSEPESSELLAQLEEQWAKLAAAEERLAELHASLDAAVVERDGRRAQAARLATLARRARGEQVGQRERRRALSLRFLQRLHGRDEEIERLRGEVARLEEQHVDARGHDRRRAQTARFVQRVRQRDEQIERLQAELERVREERHAALAAADERRAELERSLDVVAAANERRRAQTARFVQRVRQRDEQIEWLQAELERVREEQHAALAAADERRAELERSLEVVAAANERRRAQAERFVQRARARGVELERCVEESRRLGEASTRQAEEQLAALAAAEEHRVGLERALVELATDWDHRHAQAGRFARRARGLRDAVGGLRDDVERLRSDVRGCDAEIGRLRAENGRRREQAVRLAQRLRTQPAAEIAPPTAEPDTHLVFVQSADGYALVERDGPPPPRNAWLELPGGAFVVAALRRSPLPGDARPCVVAEPA
jgi:chromosome segregation ATPase